MNLPFIQFLKGSGIAEAVCWTLIHSLWQGMLLAVATGITVIATRKAGARVRYNLLMTLLFLFLVATGCTLWAELSDSRMQAQGTTQTTAALVAANGLQPDAREDLNGYDLFVTYFNRHAVSIVMIWFIIFMAHCVKMIASLAHIQRIMHYRVIQPPGHWQDKVIELAKQLLIGKPVRLLESSIVKVPFVVGILKPVILFPAGLLTGLPQDQVEAILLHELAHISRKDYLVNLVQSLSEMIFFFNPAVLWISALIREERENCCDDIAVAYTKNKVYFLKALIACREFQTGSPAYSMAFPGKKNHLLRRVQRLIQHNNHPNKTFNPAEKTLLAVCFAGMAMLPLIFTPTSAKPGVVAPRAGDSLPSVSRIYDPAGVMEGTTVHFTRNSNGLPPREVYLLKRENTLFQIEKEQNRTVALVVNGKSVDLNNNRNLLERLQQEYDQSKYKGPAGESKAAPDKQDKQAANNQGMLKNGAATSFFGKGYIIVEENNKITEVYFEGKRLANSDIPSHQQTINNVIRAAKQADTINDAAKRKDNSGTGAKDSSAPVVH